MFFSDRFKRTPVNHDEPVTNKRSETDIARDQRNRALTIMSMNRKQRRSLGKYNGGIKIPGITRPFVKPKEEKKDEYGK